jgi:hypothetical protein
MRSRVKPSPSTAAPIAPSTTNLLKRSMVFVERRQRRGASSDSPSPSFIRGCCPCGPRPAQTADQAPTPIQPCHRSRRRDPGSIEVRSSTYSGRSVENPAHSQLFEPTGLGSGQSTDSPRLRADSTRPPIWIFLGVAPRYPARIGSCQGYRWFRTRGVIPAVYQS